METPAGRGRGRKRRLSREETITETFTVCINFHGILHCLNRFCRLLQDEDEEPALLAEPVVVVVVAEEEDLLLGPAITEHLLERSLHLVSMIMMDRCSRQ